MKKLILTIACFIAGLSLVSAQSATATSSTSSTNATTTVTAEKAMPVVSAADAQKCSAEEKKKCETAHTACCMPQSAEAATPQTIGEKGTACGTVVIGMSAKKPETATATSPK